jgi:hypothetical protein
MNRHDYLLNQTNRKLGVEFQKIFIPNNQDFIVPEYSYIGYPHVSLASKDVCLNSLDFISIY